MIKQYETHHYTFHYLPGSLAEQDIETIAESQERCFEKICRILELSFPHRISYWLYDSPQIIGDIFFHGSPCNGLAITADDEDIGRRASLSGDSGHEFTIEPYSIHAVYEERIKCIGEHEDTHLISAQLCEPKSIFLCEGLAMYMDPKWWGIDNKAWAKYFWNEGDLDSTSELICLEEEAFYDMDSGKTYPIAGAWTEFIFEKYGAEKYKSFYCAKEYPQAAKEIFGCTLEKLHEFFVSWLESLDIPEEVDTEIKKKYNHTIVGQEK